MRKTQRTLAFGGLVVVATVLTWVFGEPLGELTGVQSFEDFTLDLRQRTTTETFQSGLGERESDVVLVLFDEYSVLDTIDGWDWISPFPRAHLATLVDALHAGGARTIGIDVFLGETFPGLNRIDGGNELLRASMERAGNVILVAPVVESDSGKVLQRPHPYFADVAAGVGSAELPSSFETFRDGALAVRSGTGLEPSFALSMFAHARGLDVDSILNGAAEEGRFTLPGLPSTVGSIPEVWSDPDDASGGSVVPFRIRFYGPPTSADADAAPGTFAVMSSSSVEILGEELQDPIMGEVWAQTLRDFFEDKIVVLGTGFHAEDRFRTPFFQYSVPIADEAGAAGSAGESYAYDWMYGVEIHATALQNIIDGVYVRPLRPVSKVLLLVLFAALAAGVVFWRGAAWGAAGTAVCVASAWALAYWAWAGYVYLPGVASPRFAAVGTWVPIGTPILAAVFGYVQSVAYTAIVEGREKRFIKGAFGKYLSPDVVAEISEDPSALTLGGEKRPLSLLFSDLSGFTSISEHMDAEELIALLNEYLHDMTQVVFDEDGYLDKYIGDAIMAFWNAPKEVPDHADRAMRTAIRMQRRMTALNERWGTDDPDHVPLKVRIGVHTGEVVVGNVGGEERFDYSAIGDAVNLAARLEPANKTYDTLNMVSEVTLAAGNGAYRVRELDYIAVKGKDEPVKVFELLELAGEALPPEKEAALEHYAAGMEAYKQHDWTGARAHFEAGAAACPDDGPCALYVVRCQENIEDPPPPDWDFVVRRTEK